MIKWLTAVVRLACIVRLNNEWNAAFSRPWDHRPPAASPASVGRLYN